MTEYEYRLRKIGVILWFLLCVLAISATAFSQTADTCVVTGRILLQNGRPAVLLPLTLRSTGLRYSGGPLIARKPISDTTDLNGNIRFVAIRNSTVNITSDVFGANVGVNLIVPDAATATIEALLPAPSILPSTLVLVPHEYAGLAGDIRRVDTLKFANATASWLFNTLTITPTSGGATAVSDSLDVNAREYVRRLQLRDTLDIIPREKSLADRIGGFADADSAHNAMARFALNNDFVSIRSFVWSASDTASNWTTVFQNAIDSTKGRTLVVPPGLYSLGIQGTVPYGGSWNKYCLDLKTGNVRLLILAGATLQLKSGTQTNATGAVEMMIFQDASDIWIGGGGTLSGNTAGQTGWTGGYSQGQGGRGIANWRTSTLTNKRVVIENLAINDFFSNPVDLVEIDGLRYTNLSTWGTGEGFQCVASRNVVFENLYVTDPTEVSEGDAIELSSTTLFHVNGCTVKHFYSPGQSLDLFGSSRGTVTGMVVDSASFGIDISNFDSLKCTDIAISNCVFKRIDSDFGALSVVNGITGTITISNVLIDSCVKWSGQINTNATAVTIFNGVTVRNSASGFLVLGNGRTEFNNCNFSNFTWSGMQVSSAVAGQTPDVNLNSCTFTNSDIGINFAKGTDTTFHPRGLIRNTVFTNCTSAGYANNANTSSVDYTYFKTSTNKWYSNSIPWGTDSTVTPNKGYVDTRLAAYPLASAVLVSIRDSNAVMVRTESDPTAIAKAGRVVDSAFTGGARQMPVTTLDPGTLGQVLKTTAGGVVAWAADSAGAGGGGLTNPVDSLHIARIVVNDTTGGYVVDSLKYWYKAIQLPTSAAGVGQGWVDLFIVVNPQAVTKAYSYINVVFDTAHTVYSTYGFEAFLTGWDNGSGNPTNTEQVTSNGVFYIKHSGVVNTSPVLTAIEPQPYPFSYRWVRLKLNMVGGAGYTSPVTIRLRCHYRCTAGNTSGWFVKLNDL